MADFQVTPATLRAKAEELKSLNSQLNSQIEQLASTEGALNGMWEGASREAFHQAFTSDKAQMDAFKNLVDQYCAALETQAAKYEAAENANIATATTRNS